MDALCAAIPVARALLRAADAAQPCTLTVLCGTQRATLSLTGGEVWAIRGVDGELLGDELLASGLLDDGRHRAALARGAPVEYVGAWLVSIGAASESAVRTALERQLSQRVRALLRWRGAELVLSGALPFHPEGLRVALPVAPDVFAGLVDIAGQLPADTLRQRAGCGVLRLTALGQRLRARLEALPHTLEWERVLGEPAPQRWAERATLRAIGAAVEGNADLEGYSLLLRKRRELQRRASARRLLDLPESAHPGLAKPAFRKLAQKLHPDRFQATQPALTGLSNEVMCALVSAEAELSAQVAGHARR